MHAYAAIVQLIDAKSRELIAGGEDPVRVREVLMRAESQLCAMENDRMLSYRDLVRQCGTAVMAERGGVTQRCVQKRYARVLDALAKSERKEQNAFACV